MSRPIRKRRDRQLFLTLDELAKLLQVCNLRDRALFLLMYSLALRRAEPGLLRRKDYNARRGEITVVRQKGSISGTVRVSPEVQTALAEHLAAAPPSEFLFPGNDGGLSGEAVKCAFKTACERAGLPARAAYPHILKHSRCTHLVDNGATREYVKFAAGHARASSTEFYFHLTERMRREGDEAGDKLLRQITKKGSS